jgi:outer membrane protease
MFKELSMMKQKLLSLFIFIFSLSASSLSAFPPAPLSDYAFSIEPQAGFLSGRAAELVYQSETSENLQSELLWDLKPLWYFGTRFDFSQKRCARHFGFFSALNLKLGFPQPTGYTEDRDWLGSSGELTNYSRHENSADTAVLLDFAAGLDIPVIRGSLLTLRISLGLSYTRFSWTAHDGYLRYGKQAGGAYAPLDASDPAVPVSGAVISFSPEWLYLPFGISFQVFPGRLFSGSLSFQAGPVLKYFSEDEHHFRVNTGYPANFQDSITGGYAIQGGGEVRCSPSERISLVLSHSWTRLSAKPHGEASAAPTGTLGQERRQPLGSYAGAALWMLDTFLGLSLVW